MIHFDPGQQPPVNAFWSISMYNNASYFVDNPINRYAIGPYSSQLKNNTDGSLDIYIQNASPGADKNLTGCQLLMPTLNLQWVCIYLNHRFLMELGPYL